MTSYSTCRNCAVDKTLCARRYQIQHAIKGAGITAVKFRCLDRQALYRKGQRVEITWPVYADGEYPCDESWPGTVIGESGSKFLVTVDDVDSDNGTPARDYIKNERLFVRVSASRIAPSDQPDRAICSWCELAPAPGAICPSKVADWADLWRQDGGLPPGCAARVEVA